MGSKDPDGQVLAWGSIFQCPLCPVCSRPARQRASRLCPQDMNRGRAGGCPCSFHGLPVLGGSLLSLVLSLNPLWGVPLESPICFSSAPGPDAGLSGLHPSIWTSCVGPVSRCIPVSVSELGALVWGIPGMQKMFLGLGPGVSGSIPQLSQPHIMGTVSILFWGHVLGLGARPSRSRGLSAGPHPRSTSLTC